MFTIFVFLQHSKASAILHHNKLALISKNPNHLFFFFFFFFFSSPPMENPPNSGTGDPFLLNYNANELQIASEFLSTWLPFLTRDLCNHCTQTLSDRVRSIHQAGHPEPLKLGENGTVSTPNNTETFQCTDKDCDTNSLGSWKDGGDMNDTADTNSLGSWKDGTNGCSESNMEASTSNMVGSQTPVPKVRMLWADMAQEDELEADERYSTSKEAAEEAEEVKVTPKTELSREQREYIRFSNVKRKKDFICLERVNGKIVNILDGLELHSGVFSAAEQKRIVDFIYTLEEKGKNGMLKERTYTAPQKWMRGKGRVTIQFGCCYNYALDKNGNPPGILQKELVDPIPHLFKVIIRRLVRWHVLPPTCVPDSCIVNIYDEGDCIPPHIDNHDFLRPFCTVSFLSECNILFGLNLKVIAAGEFSGSSAIPLPVGSVLVLNGNGADVAKHCVPAVPTKRISITFRKMDESKWPIGFAPEPDLQGLQPLTYELDRPNSSIQSNSRQPTNRQSARRHDSNSHNNTDRIRGFADRGFNSYNSARTQAGPANRRRLKVNVDY